MDDVLPLEEAVDGIAILFGTNKPLSVSSSLVGFLLFRWAVIQEVRM